MMSKGQILLITLWFGVQGLVAQSGIQHWDTEAGLSNNWVSQMLQDDEGYLWIATQYGLNRFDGYAFQSFHYEPNQANSLKANWVRAMTKDSTGQLWLGTFYGGISVFQPKTGIIKHYDSPASVVLTMLCDSHNAIWVTSPSGLFVKGAEEEEFRKVLNGRVKSIHDAGGQVFALSIRGIHRFEGTTTNDTIIHFPRHEIKQIHLDRAGVLWGLKEDALLKILPKEEQWITEVVHTNNTPNFNPFATPFIYEDRAENLWISQKENILLLDKTRTSIKNLPYTSLFPEDTPVGNILSMYEDQHDNFWIGTTEGLFLHAPFSERFKVEPEIPQLQAFQDVRELLQVDSILYLANSEGVFMLNINQAEQAPRKLLDGRIYALLKASNGYLYAADYTLHQINLKTFEVTTFENSKQENMLEGGMIWALAEDDAKKIWIASISDLHRFDPTDQTFERYTPFQNSNLKNVPGQDLLVDSKKRLWAASLWSGVYMLDAPHQLQKGETPKFQNFNYEETNPNSLSNKLSVVLTEGKDGAIWVGTDGGLNRIDGTDFSIKRYLRKDGLIDEKIMGLTCDEAGNIWGSTIGHGLFHFDIESEVFSFFNRSDGLTSNNFLLSALHKNQDGLLYFGSDAKVQRIDPKRVMEFEKPTINYFFTTLEFANQSAGGLKKPIQLNEQTTVELPHNYQSFTLNYTTLNFYQAEKTNYAYQLEGVHTDWQSNGTARALTFAGLRSGTYRLKVKPINPDLNFEQKYITFDFSIHPPWWQSSWAYALYGLVLVGFIYTVYRIRLRQHLQRAEALRLQELDSLKTRFFTNIAHELRTPLTIILGMATQLKTISKKEVQQKGGLIQRNGQQLLNLINQLLDLAKLEAGKLPIQFVHGDLLLYLHYLLESFHSMAATKNIRLHFLPDMEQLWMDYDKEKIKQIISNLLSNAIKHTSSGGDIYLQISRTKNGVLLSFRDTGKGISEADLPYIFERFYQAETQRVGTGVGLSLTKELIQLLDGEISVTSRLNKGSTFEVRLPILNTKGVPLAQVQIPIAIPLETERTDDLEVSNQQKTEDTPLLLLVEDNEDVCNFLLESLKGSYRLEVAENGKIGIEKALESIPDLIISDVMMPEKNGFELCQILKTDKRTSHIPIILLTAKADTQSRIEGLEQGADAYLYKPFEQAELNVRIRKLLELRQALQARYQSADFWEQALANKPDAEDEFVLRVRELVEAHLTDANFGIPQLCQKLGISRVHLHRKLKALTNQSTSHFIRRIRLQKARNLLQNSTLNVSEVAYEVGFADPAYFSRLYNEAFNEAPSVTRK